MPNTTTALTAAGETYFADLERVRASGGATGERSSYSPSQGIAKILKFSDALQGTGSLKTGEKLGLRQADLVMDGYLGQPDPPAPATPEKATIHGHAAGVGSHTA